MNTSVPFSIDRPIVLVGLMAVGKSRLGYELARALHLDFIDTDKSIEAEAGLSVAGIFKAYGEQEFRDREAVMIRRVLQKSGARVVSTGGGAILRPDSADLIFGETWSVWVRASIETILERAARRTDRPLLINADPETVLKKMVAMRYPVYERANIVVDTDHGDTQKAVNDILAAMKVDLR